MIFAGGNLAAAGLFHPGPSIQAPVNCFRCSTSDIESHFAVECGILVLTKRRQAVSCIKAFGVGARYMHKLTAFAKMREFIDTLDGDPDDISAAFLNAMIDGQTINISDDIVSVILSQYAMRVSELAAVSPDTTLMNVLFRAKVRLDLSVGNVLGNQYHPFSVQ